MAPTSFLFPITANVISIDTNKDDSKNEDKDCDEENSDDKDSDDKDDMALTTRMTQRKQQMSHNKILRRTSCQKENVH